VGYTVGDIYHLPISLFALGGAFLFLAISSHFKAIKPIKMIKDAPWQVVWFSIGLYVVVYGLKNAGLTDLLSQILLAIKPYGEQVYIILTGFISAILSSIMNNMPTIMIMDLAIDQVGDRYLAFANILGANLGPKMTPIGSLATLIWLHLLEKRGVKIGWVKYMKVGLVITPPVLFVALLGLLRF
jgi:arsenical pump membrane protein